MRQKQKWSRIVHAAKIKNEKVIKERLSDVQMVANERAQKQASTEEGHMGKREEEMNKRHCEPPYDCG